MILLSKNKASELGGFTLRGLEAAIDRGRLIEGGFEWEGKTATGVTFASLASYLNWSLRLQDDLLAGQRLDPDENTFWTCGPDDV